MISADTRPVIRFIRRRILNGFNARVNAERYLVCSCTQAAAQPEAPPTSAVTQLKCRRLPPPPSLVWCVDVRSGVRRRRETRAWTAKGKLGAFGIPSMLCNAASVTASCGMLVQFAGTVVVAMIVAIAFNCDEHEGARAASCYESCDPHATATCAASPTAPKCVCDRGYYGDGMKCWPDGRPAPVDLNDQAPRENEAAEIQWCVEAGNITAQIVGVLGSLMLLSATPLVSCRADGCSGCVAGGAALSRERAQTSWKVYAFSTAVGAACAVLEHFRIAVPLFFAVIALLGFQLSFGMMCWSRLFQGRIDPALSASHPQQIAARMAGTGTPPLTPPAPPGADYGQTSSFNGGHSPRSVWAPGKMVEMC